MLLSKSIDGSIMCTHLFELVNTKYVQVDFVACYNALGYHNKNQQILKIPSMFYFCYDQQ